MCHTDSSRRIGEFNAMIDALAHVRLRACSCTPPPPPRYPHPPPYPHTAWSRPSGRPVPCRAVTRCPRRHRRVGCLTVDRATMLSDAFVLHVRVSGRDCIVSSNGPASVAMRVCRARGSRLVDARTTLVPCRPITAAVASTNEDILRLST